MVFRRTKIKQYVLLSVITIIVLLPYLTKSLLPVEHDTFFHLSRIQHLSESIAHGNFFPAVYPTENNNFGYASPLFYSDLLLLLPALLCHYGIALSTCYKITIFLITFLSALSMYLLAKHLTDNQTTGIFASALYLFSNYHITDLYVRGAFGELFAMVFLPVVLLGYYQIVHQNQIDKWFVLCLGLTGLVLSHNLTFLMCLSLLLVLFVWNLKKITMPIFSALCKGCFTAMLLTAFFTFPMLEQLHSQTLIVDYYAKNSDLMSGAMKLWQYFANQTIFGLSGNQLEHSKTMTVNIGWSLTIFPCLFCLSQKNRKQYPIICRWTLFGYLLYLLPSCLLPWDVLPFQILQFPWRINTLALLLLCVPAAALMTDFSKRKYVPVILMVLLCSECLYHVFPVYSRTFGLTPETTWQDVLNGTLVDPYYSAYYVRVELGGGDYLPYPSCDFRQQPRAIVNQNHETLPLSYQQSYDTFTFTMLTKSQTISLPLTWYQGYIIKDLSTDTTIKPTGNSSGLVTFDAMENHLYQCQYHSTLLRKVCFIISCITGLYLIIKQCFRDQK